MSELNVGGSNMTVELDGNTISATAKTGNKQWVAVITDTHPKYNYDRDFVAYQKPKTSDRDSGTATVDDGAVIERVRYTHSGKNRTDSFYQLVDGDAYEIDEAEVTAALDGEIVPDIEEETHECEECGDEFDSEHGLAVHQGIKHSDDEATDEENTEEPTMTESNTGDTNATAMTDGGQVEVEYDGQTVTVPTTIRRSDLSGYFGSVTNTCPVEYIYVYDGSLRAEGQADETTRVIATYQPDRVASVESGWDGWEAELADGTVENVPPNTLWGRDNDSRSEPMTDGGTEEIRGSREVRHSDDEVRHYSADGHLYAYRDGDEHVVVSRGNEPRTRWTERVPAERNAVLAGEHLWTVPENWEHRVNIKGAAEARYAIYHIPETGVDVLVTVPNKNHLVDAWYGVKRVGTLSVTYDDEIAWGELETLIENARDIDEVSDDAVEALETLHRRRRSFEQKFAEGVDMYAEDSLFERAYEPVTVQEWTVDPWGDHYFDPENDCLSEFLDIDRDTFKEVVKNLESRNIIPSYPTACVDVEDGEYIPEGYDIRALVEAGASGAETIDYLVTEHHDLMTQTDWADVRCKGSSAISKNVSGAKKELSD